METRKVAVIIAGAVSLGSYEAGALTELLYALDTLNLAADDDHPKYELDVLTGGSAGAMTAAMVARITMSNYPAGKSNLFQAWVKEVNLIRLMQDPPSNALLSKTIISNIARTYLILK